MTPITCAARSLKAAVRLVIPPKRKARSVPMTIELYKERNIIERFFNKLKVPPHAIRYDKLLSTSGGFVTRLRVTLEGGILKRSQIGFKADFGRSAVDCSGLRDDQWERLKEFVPGGRKGKRDAAMNGF